MALSFPFYVYISPPYSCDPPIITSHSDTFFWHNNLICLFCVFKKIQVTYMALNWEIIYSVHAALLPNQDLPMEALICHIIPGLNKALAYIWVLCDHGCISHSDNNKVIITNKTTSRFLMQGGRDPQTVLYTLYMPTTSIQPKRMTKFSFLECFCANNANKCKSKHDLVLYCHHACFFQLKAHR